MFENIKLYFLLFFFQKHICGKTRKRKKLHEIALSRTSNVYQEKEIEPQSKNQHTSTIRNKDVKHKPSVAGNYVENLQAEHVVSNADGTDVPASSVYSDRSRMFQVPHNISGQFGLDYSFRKESSTSYQTVVAGGTSHVNGNYDGLLHHKNLIQDSHLHVQNHPFVNMLSHLQPVDPSSSLPSPPNEQNGSTLGSRNVNLYF